MDIQNRFVGFCARTVDDEREVLVQPADLAATLLLFDDYVFESCKLGASATIVGLGLPGPL